MLGPYCSSSDGISLLLISFDLSLNQNFRFLKYFHTKIDQVSICRFFRLNKFAQNLKNAIKFIFKFVVLFLNFLCFELG